MSATYQPLASDDHAAQYARVLAHSFGRTEEESTKWIARYERDQIRIMVENGQVVAGLLLLPMGQFFGGRSVPMWGVAAVGVAPEARGRGGATELMRLAAREMGQRGVALSALYPATQALYRRAGYEQAGSRFEVRLPLKSIDSRERGMAARPIRESDLAPLAALYRELAVSCDGALDRAAMTWDRIYRPPPSRTDPARGFVFENGSGQPEAYIWLSQVPAAMGKHEVAVHDLAFRTPEAGRRLLAFLAGYSTIGTEMIWHTGPAHPLLTLMGEQPYRLTLRDYWMLRLTDVRSALEARGYPRGLTGDLELELEDAEVPANAGRIVLHIEHGRGTVSAGGEGRLKMGPRGLAALYSGFLSPTALQRAGLLDGNPQALAAAAACFAGPAPGMTDFF